MILFYVSWFFMLSNWFCNKSLLHFINMSCNILLSDLVLPSLLLIFSFHFRVISNCTDLLNWLTPWSRIFPEKLMDPQLVKKFPIFYETQRCITTFTIAHHLSLFSAGSVQSILPHPTSWRSILILSSLGLPSGVFPSGVPTKTLYAPLLSSIRAMLIEVFVKNPCVHFWGVIWLSNTTVIVSKILKYL